LERSLSISGGYTFSPVGGRHGGKYTMPRVAGILPDKKTWRKREVRWPSIVSPRRQERGKSIQGAWKRRGKDIKKPVHGGKSVFPPLLGSGMTGTFANSPVPKNRENEGALASARSAFLLSPLSKGRLTLRVDSGLGQRPSVSHTMYSRDLSPRFLSGASSAMCLEGSQRNL